MPKPDLIGSPIVPILLIFAFSAVALIVFLRIATKKVPDRIGKPARPLFSWISLTLLTAILLAIIGFFVYAFGPTILLMDSLAQIAVFVPLGVLLFILIGIKALLSFSTRKDRPPFPWISSSILLAIPLSMLGLLIYAFGSYETSTDYKLGVKQLKDGSTVTLYGTKVITHRSNVIWGFRGWQRSYFYTVTDKGVYTYFKENLTDPSDAQFASIAGTDNWVAAHDRFIELAVLIFDGSGKVLEIVRLDFVSRFTRPNHEIPTFKVIQKENSIVYLTKNGYMRYNYVDKTRSRYEGTLE